MPKRKKKPDVIDITAQAEAPAKVSLAGDKGVAGTAQKVAYGISCLNNAALFLTSKGIYESPIDSEDPADAKLIAPIERRKMAVKAIRRTIEICNRVLEELEAKGPDESNSW